MEFHKIDRLGDHHHTITMSESLILSLGCTSRFLNVVCGETGRPLGARVKEHRKEVDSITGIFTRAEKTRAASICNKSAITDHVCNENHVTDWANAKVIDRESVTGSGG